MTTEFDTGKERAMDLTGMRTPTGRRIEDITFEAILDGEITGHDFRITAAALKEQAAVARRAGRSQLGENFLRAAELTAVPDGELVAMYNALRPGRSTGEELERLAQRLIAEYDAPLNALLVREAIQAYQARGLLKYSTETPGTEKPG